MADQKLNITIAGNTVELEKSLKNVRIALANSKQEANALQRELKLDPSNTDLLTRRHKELQQALELSKTKSKMLRDDLSKLDPDVDGESFFKLQKQVSAAEREVRSLSNQFSVADASLTRLTSRASTFDFDPGDGVRRFQNSLAGVEAALSTLSTTSELKAFDSATASSDMLASHMEQASTRAELLVRKVELLRSELSAVDVNINPKAFTDLQTQLHRTESEIKTLERMSVEIPVAVGTVQIHADEGIVSFSNDLHGIQEALDTIGGSAALINFDSATASADAMARHIANVREATTLTTEKLALLRASLQHLDPDIDTDEFVRLTLEIQDVEAELHRLNAIPDLSVFTSEVNGQAVTFQRNIEGVDAALSALPKVDRLLSFNTSTASAESLRTQLTNINQVAGLLATKAELLQRDLSRIDPQIDPSGFVRLSQQLSQTESQIERLDAERVTIESSIRQPDTSTFFSTVRSRLLSGLTSISSMLSGGVSSTLTETSSVVSRGVSTIGSGLLTGLRASVNAVGPIFSGLSRIVSRSLSSIGSAMSTGFTTITSPVRSMLSSIHSMVSSGMSSITSSITSSVGNIIKGGLMTIGSNITNNISSLLGGVVTSLKETMVSTKSLDNILSFADVDTDTIDSVKDSLADYARQTTFSTSSLTKSVSTLTAAGVEANKAAELTKKLGNTYSLLGSNTRDLSQIGVILAQINSASTLMAQDFNQLVDAGIGGALKRDLMQAHPEIAKTGAEFKEAMENRLITAEMVNESITRIGNTEAAKRAALVPKTIGEAFETMQETVAQKLQETYNTSQKTGIGIVQNVTSKIESMDFNPIIENINRLRDGISTMFSDISSAFKNVDFSETFSTLAVAFGKLWSSLKTLFSAENVSGLVSILTTLLSAALHVFEGLALKVGQVLSSIDFSNIVSNMVSTVKTVLSTLSSIFTVDAIASTFNTISGITSTVSDTIVSTITALGPTIKSMIMYITSVLGSIDLTPLKDGFIDLLSIVDDWWASMSTMWSKDVVIGIFNALTDVIVALVDPIREAYRYFLAFNTALFTGLVEGLSNLNVGGILQSLIDLFKQLWNTLKGFIDGVVLGFKATMSDFASNGDLDKVNSGIQNLGKFLKKVIDVLAVLLEWLEPVISMFGEFIGVLLGTAFVGALKGLELLGDALSAIAGFLQDVWEATSKFTSDAFDWISGLFTSDNSSMGSSTTAYSTYSTVGYSSSESNTSVSNTFHITASNGMNVTSLAREIKHQIDMGVI